jgi:hypothetical protein
MEELSFKIVNSWASTTKCWRDGKGAPTQANIAFGVDRAGYFAF